MTTAVSGAGSAVRFEHDAFLYESDEGYLATLSPLLAAAADGGAEIMAVVSDRNLELLAGRLKGASAAVEFIDAGRWYGRPISTIDAYGWRLRALHADQRALIIGEVQFGESEPDWRAWTRYEALLNHVFAPHRAHVVCPYDRRRLPRWILDNARRTHPHLIGRNQHRSSADFAPPAEFIRALPPTIAIPAQPPAAHCELEAAALSEVRHLFGRIALRAGVGEDRLADLTVGLNEVLTNAVTHRRRRATIDIWADTGSITCRVTDDGPGLDPLIGYDRPPLGAASGYGLWLARQLFDRTDSFGDPAGATVLLLARITSA